MTLEARYSRNVALFGADGQRKIAGCPVGIIGLGGLGSHVAQQLAYIGVLRYVLVDNDVVTESSLNRVVGAVEADAAAQTKKVQVAARTIESIQADATVSTIETTLEAEVALAHLTEIDVVFGCLDDDLARLLLTEACAMRSLPYFDLATDTGDEGEQLWYGGRIVFANGNGCLSCLGLLDQEEIRRSRMTPHERQVDNRLYGVDRDALAGTGPAVVSLNGVVAYWP